MSSINDHLSGTPPEEKDCAQTPWPIIKTLESYLGIQFILDACASRLTKKAPYYYGVDAANYGCPVADDALSADWVSDLKRLSNPLNDRRWDKPLYPAIYCNPPFSLANEFVDKMISTARQGAIVVGCLKDAGDPVWYQKVEREASFIIKFDGRIEFLRPNGERFKRFDKKKQEWVNSGVNFATIFPVFMPFKADGLAPTIRIKRPEKQ